MLERKTQHALVELLGHGGNPDKRAQISDTLLPYMYTGHG
jgi:hypothetical protein